MNPASRVYPGWPSQPHHLTLKEILVMSLDISHIVGRLSGVKETDSKVVAAEKAIATMKMAGFSKREIKKAEDMLAAYRARTGQ